MLILVSLPSTPNIMVSLQFKNVLSELKATSKVIPPHTKYNPNRVTFFGDIPDLIIKPKPTLVAIYNRLSYDALRDKYEGIISISTYEEIEAQEDEEWERFKNSKRSSAKQVEEEEDDDFKALQELLYCPLAIENLRT